MQITPSSTLLHILSKRGTLSLPSTHKWNFLGTATRTQDQNWKMFGTSKRYYATQAQNIFVVFGLGNIGKQYETTRHNVGFSVLDAIAREKGCVFVSKEKMHAVVAEVQLKERTLLMVKPTTFMNLSGSAVNAVIRSYRVPLKNILVVVDDVDLPLKRVLLKVGGGSSQGGICNIVQALGTREFLRLRFGISAVPQNMDRPDYVLQKFRPSEQREFQETLALAKQCVMLWAEKGETAAMNHFNKIK